MLAEALANGRSINMRDIRENGHQLTNHMRRAFPRQILVMVLTLFPTSLK